jgi:hypothetical protein
MTHRHAPNPRPPPAGGYALIPGEPSLPVQRSVAELVGDCGAHVVYHLKYLLYNFGTVLEGRPDDGPWMLATYEDWRDDLSWYSKGTVIRAIRDLEREGYVESRHVAGVTNAKWYTLHEDRVQAAVADRHPDVPGPRGVLKRLFSLRSRLAAAAPDASSKSAPARALGRTGRPVAAGPPAQNAQSGLCMARSPDCAGCAVRTAQPAQSLHMKMENGVEVRKETAAAPAPMGEGPAADRAAPDAAAAVAAPAEAEGAGGPPTPAEGKPSAAAVEADPAAVAALALAGFDVADARDLATRTAATADRVVWLHRKADRARAKRPGVDVRGYVARGLREGWRPAADTPPPQPPSPARVAADRADADTRARVRDQADAEVRAAADRARVDADLAALGPGQYDAIAYEVLPRQPEPVRRLVAKRGRDCWALKIAVHDELVRRRRTGVVVAAAAAVFAPERVPSLPPDQGGSDA